MLNTFFIYFGNPNKVIYDPKLGAGPYFERIGSGRTKERTARCERGKSLVNKLKLKLTAVHLIE